jgi:hypothetical protein
MSLLEFEGRKVMKKEREGMKVILLQTEHASGLESINKDQPA